MRDELVTVVALIVALIVLLLLLTGTFLTVGEVVLKITGWVLVAFIALALSGMFFRAVGNVLARLFRTLVTWTLEDREIADLRMLIERRRAMGYESPELQAKVDKLAEVPLGGEIQTRRPSLGYNDSED